VFNDICTGHGIDLDLTIEILSLGQIRLINFHAPRHELGLPYPDSNTQSIRSKLSLSATGT